MTVTILNPPSQAHKIFDVQPRRKLHITVLTAGNVIRIAPNRDILDSPPPFAGNSGFPITAAGGTVEIEWQGELWATGDPANLVVSAVEFN